MKTLRALAAVLFLVIVVKTPPVKAQLVIPQHATGSFEIDVRAAIPRPIGFSNPVEQTAGARINCNNATPETLWEGAGTIPRPTSALLMTIQSTDPDDTAGGAGARAVIVTCLREDLTAFVERVTMNGTTPVPMAEPCYRVRVMQTDHEDVAPGSTGNQGVITAQNGGTVYQYMAAAVNISRTALYTVPAGTVAVPLNSTYTSDTNQQVTIFFYTFPDGGSVGFPAALVLADQYEITWPTVCVLPGWDLEVRISCGTPSTVHAYFQFLLIDDPEGLGCPVPTIYD